MSDPILSVRDLSIAYRTGRKESVTAVSGIDLDLYEGQSLALVGESGCGKTTLGLGLLRLLPNLGEITSGSLTYRLKDGSRADLLQMKKEPLRRFRWNEAAMVFQGAMNAFNPVIRIFDHFADTLRDHADGKKWTKAAVEARAGELLETVRLDPDRVLQSYPHELSGGMKQRALIALAIALDPQVLVLDEPTTALDLLTQRSIVQQLHELRKKFGFTMVFITHDLGLAAELADRVATMYAGRIIETGSARDIFYDPKHPYTAGLINAVMPVKGDRPALESIPGYPPSLKAMPDGCAFNPRCAFATDACKQDRVPLSLLTERPSGMDHSVACLHHDQVRLARSATDQLASFVEGESANV
ncbi:MULTISPECIES: ABC transporter ATP-binding protein [Glycomyces]|uniref:ABC transporter ATP-binding protein n=2 Tax=Glycomyces TaxID=58113 RepID=A0A9X3PWF1_9ACTN|nr:ABC transporter ATP-binding protein [Glycomyces lechevalierae]MDA1387173.1 ABC transporter ATP-binding protein [Glycomyces lechevalierae]MDR7338563.1 peptide/nickel transport system ATP-binding protein [Glycomyces lechevalierae]